MNSYLQDLDISELTKMDSDLTSVTPRWQRKQQQQQQAGLCTPNKMASPNPRRTPTRAGTDRFIPRRTNFDAAHFHLADENRPANDQPCAASPKVLEYKRKLASTLLDGDSNNKILHFKDAAPAPKMGHDNQLKVLYSQNRSNDAKAERKKFFRHIPSQPEKILDAPDFMDDYYLNLLSWGSNNVLAIALDTAVYLWNASTGDIQCLLETDSPENAVTSLSWVNDGNYIAIGLNDAEIQVWDASQAKQIRSMKGHMARVSALDWNSHILTSGSRDTTVMNHDVRIAQHHIQTYQGHTQEICGLKWSPDGTQLATGANDNLVKIWSLEQSEAQHTLDQHQAAVKAIAWCPWQNKLLATGGGSADRTIRFWNTGSGTCLNSIDTYSQVCALSWSRHEKEIVSAHGYSQNQISIWKYPSMVKMADLTGHSSRVLAMAQSPDGHTMVSASADETLRFWKCLGANEAKASASHQKIAKSETAFLSSVNLR